MCRKNEGACPQDEIAISRVILDGALDVLRALGPGLLESAYRRVLADELADRGLRVDTERRIPVRYKGRCYDAAYRADLVLNDLVIVELKSVERLADIHKKQLLTYLKLSGLKLGLLLNFGQVLLKDGIVRIANNL